MPHLQQPPLWRTTSRRRLLHAGLAASTLAVAGRGPGRARATQADPSSTAYAHPEWFVDADWLLAHRADPALRLLAFASADEFSAGHIPGSARVDGPALELGDTAAEAPIARWRAEMARLMATLGITDDSTVVAYDTGSLFATRPWWVLRYLGHEDVRILDGGLAAWEMAGGAIETGAASMSQATPAASPGKTSAFRADLLAPLDAVRAALGNPEVVIIDARPLEEYVAGHIPGAVNISYPRNAEPEPPKVWRPAAELLAMYEEVGVTPDKRIIPYCNSGVRSSVTDFTLRALGYERVSLFTGSWNEWTEHADLPITSGPNP